MIPDSNNKVAVLFAALALIAASILIAVIWPQTMFPLACVLAVASVRWERTLIAAFFALAALHCIGGYFLAFLGEANIYWLFTRHDKWFAQASLAIALGLFSMSTAYRLSDKEAATWLDKLSIDDGRIRIIARIVTLIAAGLMFYMYAGFSVVDIALQNAGEIGKLRYLGSESAADAYLVVRISDALACSLPLLWLTRNRKLDYFIYGVGLIALILPLHRASILTVFLVPFVVRAREINYRKIAVVFLVLLAVYVTSQIYFLNVEEDETVGAVASALPEVRDLGWAMKLLDGNYLYGATLVQPFDPLPSLIDTWKEKHSLSYVTTTLLGQDPEERSFGGLRVTIFGESFLNLWFLGPVLLGFLFGWAAAWAVRSVNHAATLPSRYLAVTAFIWICMWLYMGGTPVLATLKFEFVILALMYFAARKRSLPIPGIAMQPAPAS